MRFKAVIFDLDGVIVSTDELHFRAWNAIARREGIEFNRKINNRLRGVSRMKSLEIILERATRSYSEQEKGELARVKNELYRQSLSELNENDVLPGVTSTLERLREAGVKLAIGSSSKNAPTILSQIGMKDYFDAVSDGNGLTKSKPNPEVFLKAAKLLGISPESCLVVEDATAGIEAAKAGGMAGAAVGDARCCPFADYRLDKLDELCKIVLS